MYAAAACNLAISRDLERPLHWKLTLVTCNGGNAAVMTSTESRWSAQPISHSLARLEPVSCPELSWQLQFKSFHGNKRKSLTKQTV